MEHIKRAIKIPELLELGQVLVIYGPRRVGKTTLVDDFIKGFQGSYLVKTGDDIITRTILSSEDLSRITNLVEGYNLFFIDEAQQIENIGKGLKLIVDTQKEICKKFPYSYAQNRILVKYKDGVSKTELEQKVKEPGKTSSFIVGTIVGGILEYLIPRTGL